MRIDFGKIKRFVINSKIEEFLRYEMNHDFTHNKKEFYIFMGTTFEKNPSYYVLYLEYLLANGFYEDQSN